jgi:hypothetical protein
MPIYMCRLVNKPATMMRLVEDKARCVDHGLTTARVRDNIPLPTLMQPGCQNIISLPIMPDLMASCLVVRVMLRATCRVQEAIEATDKMCRDAIRVEPTNIMPINLQCTALVCWNRYPPPLPLKQKSLISGENRTLPQMTLKLLPFF